MSGVGVRFGKNEKCDVWWEDERLRENRGKRKVALRGRRNGRVRFGKKASVWRVRGKWVSERKHQKNRERKIRRIGRETSEE